MPLKAKVLFTFRFKTPILCTAVHFTYNLVEQVSNKQDCKNTSAFYKLTRMTSPQIFRGGDGGASAGLSLTLNTLGFKRLSDVQVVPSSNDKNYFLPFTDCLQIYELQGYGRNGDVSRNRHNHCTWAFLHHHLISAIQNTDEYQWQFRWSSAMAETINLVVRRAASGTSIITGVARIFNRGRVRAGKVPPPTAGFFVEKFVYQNGIFWTLNGGYV